MAEDIKQEAAETTQQEQTTEQTQEDVSQETMEKPVVEEKIEEEDDVLNWADLWDDSSDNDAPNIDDTVPESNTRSVERKENKEWWEIAAEKSGVKATSEEEYIERVSKPREVVVDTRDPEIRKLKNLQAQDDKSLVEAKLKEQGWEAGKIERRIKQLEERGDLEFEAETIRGDINAVLVQRTKAIENKEREQAEYIRSFASTLNKNVADKLSKTDTLLGFKVGKDDADVKKWRDSTERYFSTNQFSKDIDAILKEAHDGNPERLIELAQFIRAKEGIAKGLRQAGKSDKAKEILSELENTTVEAQKGERTADKSTAKGWFTDPALRSKAGIK